MRRHEDRDRPRCPVAPEGDSLFTGGYTVHATKLREPNQHGGEREHSQLARLVRQLPPTASLIGTDSAAAAAAPPESVIAYKPVIKTIRSDEAVPTRQAMSGGVAPG